jgi:hypothetical protein
MSDAPETIWAWNFMPSEQNSAMRGGWDDKPDKPGWKEVSYTRTDHSQALIADAERRGMERAAVICTAVSKESAGYNLPQMALGASKCGDDIRAAMEDKT